MGLYITMWIAMIAVIVVNALSNTLPLNGQTASEITNRLEVLFTPAGYVFSIWSLIYLLLVIWLITIYRKVKDNRFKGKVGILFIISCIFNIAWLFSWHYEQFILSIIVMFFLLFTLIAIYLQYKNTEKGLSERFPFSFYLAWISVATIANVSYVLKYHGVDLGISEVVGSLVLVGVAVILGYLAVAISQDIFFPLVIVWALIGIAVKTDNSTMQYGTIVLTVILIIAALIRYVGMKTKKFA
ncbi:tryptophan-rich sensory protein [Solibacillus kalamii]|uniref:Tryptophan-rich sensory protein n=1 Tax=Solibacillus kalamii TaxID=1748298 RepID=A0ABX3ZIK5_9BACL|nr:TspO/MBR family protein [Solibacillus kalamii]MBM7663879.1 tryptophan-rich sensory protein [Solibacillus kalamii]OUZ39510.1 tryptophan-rich sensory protein [Solibacillus kalamii]